MWNLTCLILCGDFGNDLDDGAFELLDADVLKDDRALGEEPDVRGHLFALRCTNTAERQEASAPEEGGGAKLR